MTHHPECTRAEDGAAMRRLASDEDLRADAFEILGYHGDAEDLRNRANDLRTKADRLEAQRPSAKVTG